jgi:hypothetical protein
MVTTIWNPDEIFTGTNYTTYVGACISERDALEMVQKYVHENSLQINCRVRRLHDKFDPQTPIDKYTFMMKESLVIRIKINPDRFEFVIDCLEPK